MKLNQIVILEAKKPRHQTETVMVEPAGGEFGEFKVKVTFDYDPPSSSEHVRGEPHTREKHPSHIEIISIVTAEKVEERDDDDKVINTWPKGTNVDELKWWKKSDDKYVLNKVYDSLD